MQRKPSPRPAFLVLMAMLAGSGCAHSPPPPTVAVAVAVAPAVTEQEAAIGAAVAHPDRPAEDVARDADRRPAEMMAWMGIRPGLVVADLMGGRGYYTELLARAVGPGGTVYAQNNAYVVERFAGEALLTRLSRPGLENVVRLDRELTDLGLPLGGVDVAFMGLFYHDTFWMEVDRPAMNAAILAALRPGGLFVVTDHHAAEGSGDRDVKSLHRVERSLVVQEIQAAGFVLDAETDLLRHPEDDRSQNVFDEALRGKTDRFALRFRKPGP